MKNILTNKWVKLGISCLSIIYLIFTYCFAKNSLLYSLDITSTGKFALWYIVLNLFFLIIMFYTRKEIPTIVCAMLLLPIFFVTFIMDLKYPLVIIPGLIVCIVVFFASKAHETLKTILGTIYILIYIVGTIGYFVAQFVFLYNVDTTRLTTDLPEDSSLLELYSISAIEKLNENSISPNGTYRYYVNDIVDKNNGRIEIVIEPNTNDKIHSSYSFKEKAHKKLAYTIFYRGDDYLPEIRWKSDNTLEYRIYNDGTKITVVDEIQRIDLFDFILK